MDPSEVDRCKSNYIICGDFMYYCLLCEQLVSDNVKQHIEFQPNHRGNQDLYQIVKIKEIYFCKVCNEIIPSSIYIPLHARLEKHKNKFSDLSDIKIVFNDSSVTVNNDMNFSYEAWHGIIGGICLFCDLEDSTAHRSKKEHILRLIKCCIRRNGNNYFRKIEHEAIHCIICNVVFYEECYDVHCQDEYHLRQYNKCKINEKAIDNKTIRKQIDVDINKKFDIIGNIEGSSVCFLCLMFLTNDGVNEHLNSLHHQLILKITEQNKPYSVNNEITKYSDKKQNESTTINVKTNNQTKTLSEFERNLKNMFNKKDEKKIQTINKIVEATNSKNLSNKPYSDNDKNTKNSDEKQNTIINVKTNNQSNTLSEFERNLKNMFNKKEKSFDVIYWMANHCIVYENFKKDMVFCKICIITFNTIDIEKHVAGPLHVGKLENLKNTHHAFSCGCKDEQKRKHINNKEMVKNMKIEINFDEMKTINGIPDCQQSAVTAIFHEHAVTNENLNIKGSLNTLMAEHDFVYENNKNDFIVCKVCKQRVQPNILSIMGHLNGENHVKNIHLSHKGEIGTTSKELNQQILEENVTLFKNDYNKIKNVDILDLTRENYNVNKNIVPNNCYRNEIQDVTSQNNIKGEIQKNNVLNKTEMLNELIKKHDIDFENNYLFCKICSKKLPPIMSNVIEHVNGKFHVSSLLDQLKQQQNSVSNKQIQQGNVSNKQIQQNNVSNKQKQQDNVSNKQIQQNKVSNKQKQQHNVSHKQVQQNNVSNKQKQPDNVSNKQKQQNNVSNKQKQQDNVSNKQIQQNKVSNKQKQQHNVSHKQVQQNNVSNKQKQPDNVSHKQIQQNNVSNNQKQQDDVSNKQIQQNNVSNKTENLCELIKKHDIIIYKNNEKWLLCKKCNVKLTSNIKQVIKHVNGSSHTSSYQIKQQDMEAERQKGKANIVSTKHISNTYRKLEESITKCDKGKPKNISTKTENLDDLIKEHNLSSNNLKKVIYCKICYKSISASIICVKDHINGKIHKASLKVLSDQIKSSSS